MTGQQIGLVLDCHDPESLATFWVQALNYVSLGTAGTYVALVDPDGGRPKLLLQGVPESKVVKNRVHFDIEVDDVEAEAERLASLGATYREGEARSEHGSRWYLMADPEGNEFCVCDAGAGNA